MYVYTYFNSWVAQQLLPLTAATFEVGTPLEIFTIKFFSEPEISEAFEVLQQGI